MCDCFCKGVDCLKAKCTHRMMSFVNIFAVLLIWCCLILRIMSYHDSRKDSNVDAKESMIIIFMTPFQFFFSILLLLAELKKVVFVREFFYFLDSKRGRGMFIIFITMTLFDNFDKYRALTVIFGITLLIIGILNVFLFCGQSSDGIYQINHRETKYVEKSGPPPPPGE